MQNAIVQNAIVQNAYSIQVCAKKYDRIISQRNCKLDDDCAICLQSLYMKSVNYLPCTHYFHTACLNQAFQSKLYSCPLCRYDLILPLSNTGFQFAPQMIAPAPIPIQSNIDLWRELLLSLLPADEPLPFATFGDDDFILFYDEVGGNPPNPHFGEVQTHFGEALVSEGPPYEYFNIEDVD